MYNINYLTPFFSYILTRVYILVSVIPVLLTEINSKVTGSLWLATEQGSEDLIRKHMKKCPAFMKPSMELLFSGWIHKCTIYEDSPAMLSSQ